jgi:hypothetical protein
MRRLLRHLGLSAEQSGDADAVQRCERSEKSASFAELCRDLLRPTFASDASGGDSYLPTPTLPAMRCHCS